MVLELAETASATDRLGYDGRVTVGQNTLRAGYFVSTSRVAELPAVSYARRTTM